MAGGKTKKTKKNTLCYLVEGFPKFGPVLINGFTSQANIYPKYFLFPFLSCLNKDNQIKVKCFCLKHSKMHFQGEKTWDNSIKIGTCL